MERGGYYKGSNKMEEKEADRILAYVFRIL